MLENELNYNINNTLSQERNETIQRLEKHETEERDMLEDELNYNINNTLSQEGNNRLGILMQKGIEKETMFTTPITSPIEYPEDPEDLELNATFSKVYTNTRTTTGNTKIFRSKSIYRCTNIRNSTNTIYTTTRTI